MNKALEPNRQLKNSRQIVKSFSTYRFLALSVGIVLLAFFLRVHALNAESLWIDEAYSISLAQHPVSELIVGTANDQHPPLYYLILKAWLGISTSVFNARLLSVLLGTLNIAQVIHLGHLFKQPSLGLLTGLFLTVSPMHVWYSQEVRMYMLLVVLTTALTATLLTKQFTLKRWIIYGLLATLSLYTHNFAVFVLVAHGLFMCVGAGVQKSLRDLFSWTLTLSGVALAYIFWLPTLLKQTQEHTMPWIGSPTIDQIRDTFLELLLHSTQFGLSSRGQWILFAFVGLVFLHGFYKISTGHPSQRRTLVLF